MTQETINQRLIFLVENLAESARAFSEAIEESPSNTHNYTSGGRKPKPEFLEKIVLHFRNISAHWLLTGEGEPFLSPPIENTLPATNAKKISRSQIVGTNHGTAHQEHNTTPISDEALKIKLVLAETERDLAAAQKEIVLLTSQLADKERTIQILLKQNQ